MTGSNERLKIKNIYFLKVANVATSENSDDGLQTIERVWKIRIIENVASWALSSKWHADDFGWVSGEIQNDCLLLKRLIQIRFNTGSKLCNREGLHVSMMEVPILERILMRSVIFRTFKEEIT